MYIHILISTMFTVKEIRSYCKETNENQIKYVYGIKIGPTELLCHQDHIFDFENNLFPLGSAEGTDKQTTIYICTEKTEEITYFINEMKRHLSDPKAYKENPYAVFPRSIIMQFINNSACSNPKSCVISINGMSFCLNESILGCSGTQFNTTEYSYDNDGLRVSIKNNKLSIECIYNEINENETMCKYYTQNEIHITDELKSYLDELKKFLDNEEYTPIPEMNIQLIKY